MTSLIMIVVSSALVSNVVLSQFLGICSFLGVSRQIKTSASLGGAVIFVITIASAVASLLYDYVLTPLNLDYLKTIVFILVIAALVQLVEMFLKKTSRAIYEALGIYLPLITTNCAVLGVALTNVQNGYNLLESVLCGFGADDHIMFLIDPARVHTDLIRAVCIDHVDRSVFDLQPVTLSYINNLLIIKAIGSDLLIILTDHHITSRLTPQQQICP